MSVALKTGNGAIALDRDRLIKLDACTQKHEVPSSEHEVPSSEHEVSSSEAQKPKKDSFTPSSKRKERLY